MHFSIRSTRRNHYKLREKEKSRKQIPFPIILMIQGFLYFHVHFRPRLTLIQYFQLVFGGRLQLILIFFILFYIFPHVLPYSYISLINRKNTTVRNSPFLQLLHTCTFHYNTVYSHLHVCTHTHLLP